MKRAANYFEKMKKDKAMEKSMRSEKKKDKAIKDTSVPSNGILYR